MQDKYFGDEGDFVKFRLLRKICGSGITATGQRLSLGVIWYLMEESRNNTYKGKHGDRTGYLLDSEGHAPGDPDLFQHLRRWVLDEKTRRVSLLEASDLFPKDTVWYDKDPTMGPRDEWLQTAIAAVAESRVVFLDPDNGLAPPSVKKHHAKAGKYAFPDELHDFCSLEGDPTVVVYQHWRRVRAIQQITEQIREIRDCSGRDHVVTVMDCRLSRRLFYVIPSERDRELVLRRMGETATLTSALVATIGS